MPTRSVPFRSVTQIRRDQPSLRLRGEFVDARMAGYATEQFIGFLAPTQDYPHNDTPRAAFDLGQGTNVLVRKATGALAFYKVVGRSAGSLLLEEVA
jgi:hypothetical protein